MVLKIKNNVSGLTKKISIRNIVLLFKKIAKVLEEGIKKAREVGKGIVPSYLIYNVSKYERTGYINHTGYETVIIKEFDLQTIPPFLEASARMFKLGKSVAKLDDYKNIKASDLYDKKLHIYKTCASIDDAPFEIGRVHAFTKGWLERECNFLHMSYKYLLGLLKGGYYKQFYLEAKDNLVVNMDTNVYGRSILENSSFIVPTCNPDSSKHGQGFFARLTGANAEMINMVNIMFIGEHPFRLKEGKLTFVLEPKLSKEMFDKDGKASCRLFTNVEIIYFNPNRINAYEAKDLIYKINNKEYKEIPEDIAIAIREGKINKIEVEIK